MNFSAILLAAGMGTRYKGKKQDALFHGVPLWKFAYNSVNKVIDKKRIVVVGKDVPGGVTRSGSVQSGLKSIPSDTDRVIILEAARPLVTETQLLQLLDDSHPSTTFVRPLVNTVIFKNGVYINRNDLFDLLTPQAFDYKMLLEAYSSGKFTDETDETIVMFKYFGIKPFFIVTGNNLYKVTYPGDLDVLESLYKNEKGSN
jgi:2-C-methyl-D-erythritol 4-phosphate cytidylyltransferase